MNPENKNKLLAFAIIASQFAPPFMFSGVAVALPGISAELKAGASELGLMETLFLASQLTFLLPGGRLADVSDKRTMYKIGLACFGFTSLLIGFLSSMPLILALRFVQGAASALFTVSGPAILAEIVPVERRGRAFGASISVVYVGLLLGPLCAGYLINMWSWRAVFVAGGALLLLGFLLIHKIMESHWVIPPRNSVPLIDMLLIFTSVSFLVAGSSTMNIRGIGYASVLASIIVAVLFVRRQRHVGDPLVNILALVENRHLRSALIIQLLLYLTAFCSTFLLNIYMQVVLGYSASATGKILAVGSLVMVVVALKAGVLCEKYPPRIIATLGVACVLVSMIAASMLDAYSGIALLLFILALQGLGFGLFSTPNMVIIMGSVSPTAGGMASAFGAKARSLGMVLGMIFTAALVSHIFANDPFTKDPLRLVGLLKIVFSVLAVTTGVALMGSVARRST